MFFGRRRYTPGAGAGADIYDGRARLQIGAEPAEPIFAIKKTPVGRSRAPRLFSGPVRRRFSF